MAAIYKHYKRGTYYEIVFEEATLEVDMEKMVVYRALADGTIWIRPRNEFFDGRFVPMIEDPKHEYPPEHSNPAAMVGALEEAEDCND